MLGQGLVKFWSLASLCFQTPTFLSAFLQPGGCRLVHGWEGEECVRRFSPTVSIFVQQSQFLAGSPNFCFWFQLLFNRLNFWLAISILVWQSQVLVDSLSFCIILFQSKSQFVLLLSGFVQKSQFLANDINLCNLCNQSLSSKFWVSFFVWLSQLLLGSFNFCPTVSDSVLTGLIASFHCDEEILKWKLS